MVRALVVVVLMVGLAATAALGYRWLATGQAPGEEAQVLAECYPLQQTCRWQTAAGEASVSMASVTGDELLMNVTLPGVSGQVIVILTGESMYMGEYPLRMEDLGQPGQYRVLFVPPFCSSGDNMVWRVNLRAGTEVIAIPFRLLFSHPAN